MTNKYKLKKWYPSLPKDWEVGMEIGAGLLGFEVRYFPYDTKYIGRFIYKNEVENNPEFWEKVVEKDWEIVSLKIGEDKSVVSIGYGRWGNGSSVEDCTLEWLLQQYPNSIYSIKRLSDGEIFSVGDKLDLRAGGIRKITGISLDDSGVSEFSKRSIPWLECGKDYGTCLDWAVHYKEPILITEDGKEIFEGDSYWRVIAVLENQRVFVYTEKVDEKGEFIYRGGGGLFFSTKEAAEKYIEENKPIISKRQLASFLDEAKIFFEIPSIKYTTYNYLYFVEKWLERNGLKKRE